MSPEIPEQPMSPLLPPHFYSLEDWLCPLPSVQEEAMLNDTMAGSPSYLLCVWKLQLNMGWKM